MYRWHKLLRQSIFLIAGIYASDPSPRVTQSVIPLVTQSVIPRVTQRGIPSVTPCVIPCLTQRVIAAH